MNFCEATPDSIVCVKKELVKRIREVDAIVPAVCDNLNKYLSSVDNKQFKFAFQSASARQQPAITVIML